MLIVHPMLILHGKRNLVFVITVVEGGPLHVRHWREVIGGALAKLFLQKQNIIIEGYISGIGSCSIDENDLKFDSLAVAGVRSAVLISKQSLQ